MLYTDPDSRGQVAEWQVAMVAQGSHIAACASATSACGTVDQLSQGHFEDSWTTLKGVNRTSLI
jgi:hypothetical protein